MAGSTGARTHRSTVLRVILVTQLCVALLTGGTVALAYHHVDKSIQSGDALPHQAKKSPLSGKSFNILIMGTDTRSGQGDKIDSQGGCGCSDTTILLHVSADRSEVYGVSLPRDALVDRPACRTRDGKTSPPAALQMFNAAFSIGGPQCTVAQVIKLTGLHIDHYVVVNFAGFKKMVDAIHGVRVCIPRDVPDQAHGIVLKAGTQTLDGNAALEYVRERYVLSANADIGRMKRQQAFIASMLNKVISAGTLAHPDRVYHFAEAAAGSVTTDPGLASLGKLVKLVREMHATNLSNIKFITVPFHEYQPDPNRLVLDPVASKLLWKRMLADKPLSKQYNGQVITAQSPPGDTATASPSRSASSTPPTPSSSPSPSSSASQEQAEQAAQDGLCT